VERETTAEWTPRYAQASALFRDRMWVLGGDDTLGPVNDVWYSDMGRNWTRTVESVPWTPATGACRDCLRLINLGAGRL